MNSRERLLAIGFGAVIVLVGGNWLFESLIEKPLDDRRSKADRLTKRIGEEEQNHRKGISAARQMEEWEKRSLPSDPQVARSAYQAWLLELVGSAGLGNPNVDSAEPVSRKGIFDVLAFSVRGRASLAQLTQFLHGFYRAGHLHKIESLVITPLPRQDELDIAISIEAVVLPTADRKDRLTDVASDSLASEALDDYRVIVDRNIFNTGGGGLDATAHAFLTAVLDVDGRAEAWFSLRATDELLKLHVGEKIEVGQFHGEIAEIVAGDVILAADDERWLITVGESLAEASTLPPEY